MRKLKVIKIIEIEITILLHQKNLELTILKNKDILLPYPAELIFLLISHLSMMNLFIIILFQR